MEQRFKTGYKVFDYDFNRNKPKTLYHGVNGSRLMRWNTLITAQKKRVSEGGAKYTSGFHLFDNKADCIKYSRKFKNRDGRFVFEVRYLGNRRKPSNNNVILADKIYIPNNQGLYSLSTYE